MEEIFNIGIGEENFLERFGDLSELFVEFHESLVELYKVFVDLYE